MGLEGIRRRAGPGRLGAQVVAHLGAHLADLLAQLRQVLCAPQHLRPHAFKRAAHILAADQYPRPHQGLMLPGPGLVFLIAGKGPRS